ncbi:hypothetical protein [Rhizobium laguerreae]|uniref:hypothetical protein n=1 Tax=Rhizobium laguerreae TaxID=1076926 RepID=UPI0014414DA1|nr:hypothetical protein [Rhizobium laguerreae]NKM69415.1 hypothetical protein [Rhizobium laguerreae]
MAMTECKDVSEMASVEFDDSLIVSLYSNPSQQICRFSVALPPNLSASVNPGMTTTYAAIGELNRIRTEFKLESDAGLQALSKDLGPRILEALKQPFIDGTIKTENSGDFLAMVGTEEARRGIQRCVAELLPNREPFRKTNGLISCGVFSERSFGIQARSADLSYAIMFPAY